MEITSDKTVRVEYIDNELMSCSMAGDDSVTKKLLNQHRITVVGLLVDEDEDSMLIAPLIDHANKQRSQCYIVPIRTILAIEVLWTGRDLLKTRLDDLDNDSRQAFHKLSKEIDDKIDAVKNAIDRKHQKQDDTMQPVAT